MSPRQAISVRGARSGRNLRAFDWMKSHPRATALAATAAALGAAAVYNVGRAAAAERNNPPIGRFLEVDGVRLHYLARGEGPPLVLLHGNGSMIEDFATSGLVDLAARRHRVIVFDRPGYGHSSRPRDRIWTAARQADLIRKALERLGVGRALVLGHSWGASVAVEMGLRHADAVRGLALVSGYYNPSLRPDFLALGGPSVPGVGDVLRYTVSPLLGRLLWPQLMRTIFGPAPTPAKFRGFPKEMALRPSQIRASAAESALLIPTAMRQSASYPALEMPVVIVAGAADRFVSTDDQSRRLHDRIAQSSFRQVPGAGHMVHQTAPEAVMAAIDELAAAA